MRYRITAATLAAVAVLFAGYTAAFACSPAPPEIQNVHPGGGATVAPKAAFSISHSGSLDPVTLHRDDGTEVDLEQTAFYGSRTFGGTSVYEPAEPLAEGATYTLEATIANDRSYGERDDRRLDLETTYTVEAPEGNRTLPQPTDIRLYTVKTAKPSGAACSTNRHRSQARFDLPADARSNVGYATVTFRDRPTGQSGANTATVVIDPDDYEEGVTTFEAGTRLSFEPQCAAVDVYSPDRTVLASSGTCQREVCAQTGQTYLEKDISEFPACNLADGCGGCSSGGDDRTPGGLVPALLVAALFMFRRRRSDKRR